MSDHTSQLPPEHFLSLIRQQQRGRLKIYLGFAAGVGKTYEMLQEGQRLKRRGVDVVVGFVETHGRAETAAQIGDLEQIPRHVLEYRGVHLEELDLDAIVHRRPAVALIDDIAHTNVPGSRHSKRYQDIEELLSAGINVVTTLNIQNLETLYDLIQKATGVKVKERVPDYIIGMADQLINVDMSVEDLRERLRTGKIYSADRIDSALENFFTQSNLTHLRELSLQEIAHRLDQRRSAQKSGTGVVGTSVRVMVCLSSRGPHAEHLIRKGARLADRYGAPWYAVFIETTSDKRARVNPIIQKAISNSLALVQQLGGVVMTFKGDDPVNTIAAFATEYDITHLVLGRTQRPWYRRWFGQSVLDRLLHALPDLDVLVSGEPLKTKR